MFVFVVDSFWRFFVLPVVSIVPGESTPKKGDPVIRSPVLLPLACFFEASTHKHTYILKTLMTQRCGTGKNTNHLALAAVQLLPVSV